MGCQGFGGHGGFRKTGILFLGLLERQAATLHITGLGIGHCQMVFRDRILAFGNRTFQVVKRQNKSR